MTVVAAIGWFWTALVGALAAIALLGAALQGATTDWVWLAVPLLAPGLLLMRRGGR